MNRPRIVRTLTIPVAAALAGITLLPVVASASPAHRRVARAPHAAAAPATAAAASPSAYSGLSDGSVVYANALKIGTTNLAKLSLAQSAAGVNSKGPLTTNDQLGQALTALPTSGKTSYGHGAPANIGLATQPDAQAQIKLGTADATAPAPSTAMGKLASLPLAPIATADLLPGTAAANTKSDNSCVTGNTPISTGDGRVANAKVLTTDLPTLPNVSVVSAQGTSETNSTAQLTTVSGSPNAGLQTGTVENVAPITLFAGTPGAITIKVLAPLHLSATAGGVNGSAKIDYGFDVASTQPVVSITAGGTTTNITSAQLFGQGGVTFGLGLADITIGTPAHSLTGLEGTPPSVAADGTSASAAADFIRITVPGTLPIGTAGGGALGGPLNGLLGPIATALNPVLTALQTALAAALQVADLRIGHLEASATVPVGGIVCPPDMNPLSESMKDVSTLSVPPGGTFNYDIRIPNRGTSPVTNVTVKDTYSSALQFVSSVPAPASHVGNVLTYNLGTLQPNEFRTIVFTFTVPTNAVQGTKYHNHADISGTYQDQPITVPVDVGGPTVGPPGTGGCDLTHSTKFASNIDVTTGENFGYFLNVSNTGGKPCTNVTVTDPVPAGTTFVSCTANCTVSGNTVTWKLGTFAPGESRTISFVVKVTATQGTLPNVGHITTPDGPPANPSTPGPTVTDHSTPSPGKPAGNGNQAARNSIQAGGNSNQAGDAALPYTGSTPLVPLAALGLIGMGVGAGFLRRRRS